MDKMKVIYVLLILALVFSIFSLVFLYTFELPDNLGIIGAGNIVSEDNGVISFSVIKSSSISNG